jgi:hypothetical protein
MPARTKSRTRKSTATAATATATATAAVPHPDAPTLARLHYVLPLLSGLLATYTFWETRRAGFVWDDRAAIKGNPDVIDQTSTFSSALYNIWTHDFWGKPLNTSSSHKSYRPLCVMTFHWNYRVSGLEASSYHLLNVLLHAGTTMLVYGLTHTCMVLLEPPTKTAQAAQAAKAVVAAAVASALFAVHPIHVEAVAGYVVNTLDPN